MKIELNATERLMYQKLFPETESTDGLVLMDELDKKLKLSPEERKKIELAELPGKVSWNVDKAEKLVEEFELSGVEISFLKTNEERVSKAKAAPRAMLSLNLKIRDMKVMEEVKDK